MDIGWIETIVYGIISGLTEYAPVSSRAHQTILQNLFGCYETGYLLNFFTHIGMLTALLATSGNYIKRLYKEYSFSKGARRRRKREVNLQAVCDIHIARSAFIPVLLSYFLYSKTRQWENMVPVVALLMAVNGAVLIVPMYLLRGNKDSRNMTTIDSILFGVASAFSILPGISRIGAGCSMAIARGADPQHAYKWSLILSIPAILILLGFDFYYAVSSGFTGMDFVMLIKCILCGVCSCFGSVVAITILKNLTKRSGISGFAYYSFGAALFAFIIYLY